MLASVGYLKPCEETDVKKTINSEQNDTLSELGEVAKSLQSVEFKFLENG